ncbi:MAG: polysaccharide export protein [Rikenellaceae bacterium]|nr:polysaccharide export protein [Rikenellaceae bacterium]
MKTFTKIVALFSVAVLCSCNVQKKVVYLQDFEQNEIIKMAENYEVRIKPNDRLKIIVTSKNPELASPFNSGVAYNALAHSEKAYTTSANGDMSLQTRTVRPDGKLEMPIIGDIECSGKTRNELALAIAEKIREGKYISDPIVNVQFADMKITVMGEVTRPGQFDVVRDEITILDALAMAGDMTIYGERDAVAVIRKIDGKSVVNYLDLRKKETLASPFYHLQPNDVVYVKPNRYKSANAEINQNRSFWISIVSTLVSVATLVTTIVLNTSK